MDLLRPLTEKDSLLVIGLMSGTSADGMDAALTRITGYSTNIRVETLAFETRAAAGTWRCSISAWARNA